jgi:hypothetical protein
MTAPFAPFATDTICYRACFADSVLLGYGPMRTATEPFKSELERLIRQRWKEGESFTTTQIHRRLDVYLRKRNPKNRTVPQCLNKYLQILKANGVLARESIGRYTLLPKIKH